MDYYVYVYFDDVIFDQVYVFCEIVWDIFGVFMGYMYFCFVGFYFMGFCQLSVIFVKFVEFLLWVVLNRDGLIIFVYLSIGDYLVDYRDYVIWFGIGLDFDLFIFGQLMVIQKWLYLCGYFVLGQWVCNV